jgi:hypothetical protein
MIGALRIDTGKFCGLIVLKHGVVVDAAPCYRRMIGWKLEEL